MGSWIGFISELPTETMMVELSSNAPLVPGLPEAGHGEGLASFMVIR